MLKAAVIGCGRMGAEPSSRMEGIIPAGWLPISHAESLRQLSGVELVAFADTDASRLERHGRGYGVTALYSDYRHLLDEIRPDIVTIATRTPGKTDILRHACATGARVIYVEKPLANSLLECRAALASAAAAKATIGYGVNRRYHAVYRYAKQLISSGEIGEVLDIVVEFGRSQLLWTHPHAVDLILFFAGNTGVVNVSAQLSGSSVHRLEDTVVDSDPVVEHAHFDFDSGIRATITRSAGCNIKVSGSRGALTVHGDGAYIQISRPHREQDSYFLDQQFFHPRPAVAATVTALKETISAAESGAAPPITPAEIEMGLRMLLACVWSHIQNGASIDARQIPENLTVTGRYRDMYA